MNTAKPYACLNGHIIYSTYDLSRYFCPICLGRVKERSLGPTNDDPRLLSAVQEEEKCN